MAIADAIPTIVAARVTRQLESRAVFAARVNRSYTAEARVGNQVNILPRQAVTVAAYDPAATAALAYTEQAPGTAIALALDQYQSFQIKLEDVYARQAIPDILTAGIESAAEALSVAQDTYVRDAMHTLTKKTLDMSTIAAKLSFVAAIPAVDANGIKRVFRAAAREMTRENIPLAGRWAIVGPVLMSALNELFESGALGDATLQDTVRNGFRGSLYGLRIYETANPVKVITGDNLSEQFLFGNDYGFAFIRQMENIERLRLVDRHATAIRGLAVYGGVFIESTGFYEGNLNYENLPAFA